MEKKLSISGIKRYNQEALVRLHPCDAKKVSVTGAAARLLEWKIQSWGVGVCGDAVLR